jgi:hypothetical protein
MKYKDFEDFLMEKFIGLNEFNGTPIIKDNVENLFPDWFDGLDKEDISEYADKYGNEIMKDINIRLDNWLYKNHNPEKDCNCDKCKYYNEIKVVLGIK